MKLLPIITTSQNIPSSSFNYHAHSVPAIVTLAGIFLLIVHALNFAFGGGYFNTALVGVLGFILFIIGIFLFIVFGE